MQRKYIAGVRGRRNRGGRLSDCSPNFWGALKQFHQAYTEILEPREGHFWVCQASECRIWHLKLQKGKDDVTDQFSIDGVVSTDRDLGVIISNDLSPSVHINDIVFKAPHRANLISRCLVSHNRHLLLRAFVTYVRPLLDYDFVLYDHHLEGAILTYSNKNNGDLLKDCRVFVIIPMRKNDHSYLKFLNLKPADLNKI